MARRGEQLREHILRTAKAVFLEQGFERTSMDEVASRAETSKRSLYAYFENKEKLFLAIIDLVRGLFLAELKTPGEYSEKPEDALTLFCSRYLEILLYEGSIQMIRICMAEATHFPEASTQHFDVMFTEVHQRLASYFKSTYRMSSKASSDTTNKLMGQLLYPRLTRAIFGLETLSKNFGGDGLSASFDTKPVRKVVAEIIETIGN